MEHYGDNSMPMQLRMLAEEIIGSNVMGRPRAIIRLTRSRRGPRWGRSTVNIDLKLGRSTICLRARGSDENAIRGLIRPSLAYNKTSASSKAACKTPEFHPRFRNDRVACVSCLVGTVHFQSREECSDNSLTGTINRLHCRRVERKTRLVPGPMVSVTICKQFAVESKCHLDDRE